MRYKCKECGGSQICEHGKDKRECKECGGSSFCAHGKKRRFCPECGGSGLCEHGRNKRTCKECGGSIGAAGVVKAMISEHGSPSGACGDFSIIAASKGAEGKRKHASRGGGQQGNQNELEEDPDGKQQPKRQKQGLQQQRKQQHQDQQDEQQQRQQRQLQEPGKIKISTRRGCASQIEVVKEVEEATGPITRGRGRPRRTAQQQSQKE